MKNKRKKYKNKMNISGSKIRELRESKKMSREFLSNKLLLEEEINISSQSIANIENNARTVSDNAINHVDNIGAYILKYITKDNNDSRLMGQKAYLTSRNLTKPEEVLNHDLKDFYNLENKIINKYHLNDLRPVYSSNYDTEILGSCSYKQYNLKRKE